ncbi:MAG: response regulator [Candidatus Anammoxibacter sp.]
MGKLVFKDKTETNVIDTLSEEKDERWKIMIVDDEQEVHSVTRFALRDYEFKSKKLEFVSAYSGEEAKRLLIEHSDTAIILLDIVMEEDDSGLKLVEHIRGNMKNKLFRIIIRTGQPGEAPEEEVIFKYDINDYKEKTELTDKKLITALTTALHAYSDLMMMESYQETLEQEVEKRTLELKEKNDQIAEKKDSLQKQLDEIKVLRGLLPICAKCKKIRKDNGYWEVIETYIHEHTEADFSHSICPECIIELYPEQAESIFTKMRKNEA